MPKIVVTDRLADTLKMLRMQNGVKAKELAEYLGKTPGYISKLEKLQVKNIELEVVESIFAFILGDNYEKTEIWEQIHASLQIKYSKNEIEEEIWFSNFDTVYRYIPIPDSIIELINKKIEELNITRELLLKRINANEALPDEEKNNPKIKSNIWYPAKTGGASIKISMSEKMFTDILDKQMLSSPYVFIFCILYYILKIEKHGDVVDIGDSEIRQIYNKTTEVLNAHKFYSIIERDSLVNGAQSKEEIQELLSSFDNDNAKLIGEILSKLKFASELDIRITNERLTRFLENLDKNVWFTLKIISLNYDLLETVDMAQKKEFINDIEGLIQKYTDTQKDIKNTETY